MDTQASAISHHLQHKGHVRATANRPSQALMVQQVQTEQSDKQTAVMRTVFFMAEQDIPDCMFEALINLQRLNDCVALKKGEIYSHHSYVTEIDCIASDIRQTQSDELNSSPFCQVLSMKLLTSLWIKNHFLAVCQRWTPQNRFLWTFYCCCR